MLTLTVGAIAFYPADSALAQEEAIQQLEDFLEPEPEPEPAAPVRSAPPAPAPAAAPVHRSPPPLSLSNARPVALTANRQQPGTLGHPDQLAEGFYQDLYEFRGQQGEQLLLNLIGSNDPRMQLDPYLRLLGPDGDLVAEDDNSGRDRARGDARIRIDLPRSGTYTVVVTSAVPQDRGRYTLALLEVETLLEEEDRPGCRSRVTLSVRLRSELC